MTSYIPEMVYGQMPGSNLEYGGPRYGLIPWPAHMTPRGANSEPRDTPCGVDLTKKGEAYVAAALAEADGVFFVTVDKKDRASIATSIEKLINMLDDLSPDPDLEPDADGESYLGWPGRGPSQEASDGLQDDREADFADDEATALERHGKGFCASGADDSEESDHGEDNGDLEFNLGWEQGSGPYSQENIRMYGVDEVEAVSEDEAAQCDDEGVQEYGIADKDALALHEAEQLEGARFDGHGSRAARAMLRQHRDKGRPARSPHTNVTLLSGGPFLVASDFERQPWA